MRVHDGDDFRVVDAVAALAAADLPVIIRLTAGPLCFLGGVVIGIRLERARR